MSLFFDNDKLFDADGHLTDAGLYALKDGTLDDLGALEAAEHLSFCDLCLLRYTALLDSACACIQKPMRDLIPQVQALMRLRSFRFMTNRYVSAAAAVILAFGLWRIGAARLPDGAAAVRAAPSADAAQDFDVAVDGFYDGLDDLTSKFYAAAEGSLAQLRHWDGGAPAKGE